MSQGLTYDVDIALVIDATGSMSGIIDKVKDRALAFYEELDKAMKDKGKFVDQLRIRVIAYRDFYFDSPDEAFVASPFFTLPAEKENFASFVRRLAANGGGDEPENGLEALAEAIRSPWSSGAVKRRQVIVVWTDASTHKLEHPGKPAGYPGGMPKDLNELTDMWDGQSYVNTSYKRLIIYAPDAYAWSEIGASWDNAIHYPSKAGEGLAEVDYLEFLNAIANSV